jgi:hypothetical protein
MYMDNENIIYINENTIFKKNIEVNNNVEINNCMVVDGGMVIEGDLNTKNQNIFGLLSIHGNVFSEGDLYISSNKNDNYTYINDGSLECNSINMKNKILLGNKDYTIDQKNNSIIINSSNEILNSSDEGLYIHPLRYKKGKYVLYYDNNSKEISYYDDKINTNELLTKNNPSIKKSKIIYPMNHVSNIDNNSLNIDNNSLIFDNNSLNVDPISNIIYYGITGPQGMIGLRGLDGAQGIVGKDGPRGFQGPQGNIGKDGPRGFQGPQGNIGKDGLRGFQGPQGNDGKDGLRGFQGPNGNDGKDGLRGFQGPQGNDGKDGPQGNKGDKGDSIHIHNIGNGSIVLKNNDEYYYSDVVEVNDNKMNVNGTLHLNNIELINDTSKCGWKIYNEIDINGSNLIFQEMNENGELINNKISINQISLGITGPKGVKGEDGDKFSTRTIRETYIHPNNKDIFLLFVSPGLAYIAGNSVIVVDYHNYKNSFEGTIHAYNKETGGLQISEIVNIKGNFDQTTFYDVNLDGQDGPPGPKGDTGPSGNVYNTNTLEEYNIDPNSDSVSFYVEKNMSYIRGNHVVVISVDGKNRFEGIVSIYDKLYGLLLIHNIKNISENFDIHGKYIYNINLNGVPGPKGVNLVKNQIEYTHNTENINEPQWLNENILNINQTEYNKKYMILASLQVYSVDDNTSISFTIGRGKTEILNEDYINLANLISFKYEDIKLCNIKDSDNNLLTSLQVCNIHKAYTSSSININIIDNIYEPGNYYYCIRYIQNNNHINKFKVIQLSVIEL